MIVATSPELISMATGGPAPVVAAATGFGVMAGKSDLYISG